jgi:hypothetical protein
MLIHTAEVFHDAIRIKKPEHVIGPLDFMAQYEASQDGYEQDREH